MERTHFSADEAAENLAAMAKSDWQKVYVYARFLVRNSREDTGYEDLVDEAVAKTLEGKRKWKIGMDAPSHFFGVMKSILSNWNKKVKVRQAAQERLTILAREQEYRSGAAGEDLVDSVVTNAQKLAGDESLGKVERRVLDGLLSDKTPGAIRKAAGISSDEYKEAILLIAGRLGSSE